jgi:hypothetical protein
MTWDQIVTWLVLPGAVALVCGVEGILAARWISRSGEG